MSKKQGKVVQFPESNIENSPARTEGKRKRTPLKTVIATIAAVFVVCLVCAVIVHSTEESSGFVYRLTTYLAVDKNESGVMPVYEYQSGKENVYASLKNGLVMASKTDIKLYNRNGDTVFTKPVDLSQPAVSSSGNTAVVFDRADGDIIAFTGIRDVYEGKLDGEISDVFVSESGGFAVMWRESGYRSSITVFNNRGKEIYYCGYTSGYATSAALSPKGTRLAVAVTSQQDGSVRTRIDLYELDSDQIKSSEKIGDELVIAMGYPDNKTLCCVCENGLEFLDSSTLTEKGEYSYEGMYIKDYSFGIKEKTVVLFNRYKGGGKCFAAVVGTDGTQLASYSTESDINSMDARGKTVAMLLSESAVILNSSLEPLYTIDNFTGHQQVIIRSDSAVIFTGISGADLYVGKAFTQGGKK